MANHHSPQHLDLSLDRTLGNQGPVYVRRALIFGAGCLVVAAILAFFSGQPRIAQTYDPANAPTALVGVVELLAEKEGKSIDDYVGHPIAEIATQAKTHFGEELPAHWDDFLHQSPGRISRFMASYLVAFMFAAGISIGGLFFVLIQHITRAGWSVVLRRITEIYAASSLWIALLSLPIVIPLLFGSYSIYSWNDPQLIATDILIQHKLPYLNPTFFALRALVYFSIWIFYSRRLLSLSLLQDDTGDPSITNRMQAITPFGLVLFALSTNFFAFDFMMSVAPQWFSTIYGVYYFAGCVVSILAVTILTAQWLQRKGIIGPELTVEHFHDLGKLMFGFTFFWGYIAFSQYLLIWYANIPEETTWLIRRQENGWVWISLLLLFGQLLIPFLGIMSRWSRRNYRSLIFWSCWLLVMHWIDLFWNVLPEFTNYARPTLMDVFVLLGVLSLFAAGVLHTAGQRSVVPLRDPRVSESLAFHNL